MTDLEQRVLDIERELLPQEQMKQLMKDAIREWLDEKFAQFGKWSLMAIFAAAIALLAYLLLWSHGWRAPPVREAFP